MNTYDHKKVEKKWQKYWESKKMYRASDKSDAPKFYALVEFPFPSGAGLHTGHIRSYSAMDAVVRKRRAEGQNVLYPIGWDAYGLPTENYAIKTGIQPAKVTKQNTDNFRRQLKSLGISFDWSREVNTTDPAYYKWTQWIFLQMFKKGLAYKSKAAVNWCPKDKTVLANEEVIDGACERCGTAVIKKEKEQWMLAITKYANRLDKDLDDVNYLEKIKIQQRNWIGRSEGSEITFKIKDHADSVTVFTTRADTLFGVTYIVLAPEHALVQKLAPNISNWDEVQAYIETVKQKEDIERTAEGKPKTGVALKGISAIHPATGETLPVWIADYVLASYGTGAVMAVPAHDARDDVFATTYNLPRKEVVLPNVIDVRNPPQAGLPVVERKTVHAIIRNPKTNKYVALKWKKFPWTTFPMGGVDSGEDVVEAAKREVLEEVGFKNLKFVEILGGQVRAEYCASHKGQNRVAFTTAVVFELIDEERVETAAEEQAAFDVIWVDRNQINYQHMTHSEIDFWNQRLSGGSKIYTGDGVLVLSDKFSGLTSEEARKKITESVCGKWVTKYKLRDWVFSRQRYWGEPIPMVHCQDCGWVPVPEKDLPLELPKIKEFEPTDTGESPLATLTKWVNTTCPTCKKPAKRETDTMPQWAGSSWYYLRYTDPTNKKALASEAQLKKWAPVDWYNGGMEHTTLHLLYSRFWHKFLYDIGAVYTKEPYQKRTSHGMILAEGGEKMSKSKGNTVSPDELVELYGADTLRVYEMFMGPFDQAIAWNTANMIGSRRFLERVWNLEENVAQKQHAPTDGSRKQIELILNQTIKKVGEDIESTSFNTCISSLMILLNALEKEETVYRNEYETLLQLIAPFAPHITEELWTMLGNKQSIHLAAWPQFDPTKLVSDTCKIVVQINGKVRDTFESDTDDEEIVKAKALSLEGIRSRIGDKTPSRVIYVKRKLVNIVISE